MKIWDVGAVYCRTGSLIAMLAALSLSAVGCGQKVEMKTINPTEGMSDSDVATVKEHLKKANITGDVMKMEDLAPNEDAWLVVVNMMGAPEPGKRPTPIPPKSYRVYKSTGKVESSGM
jgi:hypothetical protein